jgi:hypothetical protein
VRNDPQKDTFIYNDSFIRSTNKALRCIALREFCGACKVNHVPLASLGHFCPKPSTEMGFTTTGLTTTLIPVAVTPVDKDPPDTPDMMPPLEPNALVFLEDRRRRRTPAAFTVENEEAMHATIAKSTRNFLLERTGIILVVVFL